MMLIGYLAREVYEYQHKHGGKSPSLMLVPKALMDILNEEAKDLPYTGEEGMTTICGVKVLVDASLRIANMVS